MELTTFNLIVVAGAVGSVITAILALYGAVKVLRKAMFKNETLYGQEAEERYLQVKDKLPKANMFGPYKYGGGNKIIPQFEVERFYYDPQTTEPEWRGCTKSIRYYYKENGETMVK